MVKLIYGLAVNDVEYAISKRVKIGSKTQMLWRCPYYLKWHSLLRRCFSAGYINKYPSYSECSVVSDWLLFSNFIRWVDSQPNRDWENCDLDKDLLVEGNKCYGYNTCVFLDKRLNLFLVDRLRGRGKLMIGVSRKRGYYQAHCCDPFTNKQRHLGHFKTELDAHKAWQKRKHEYACQLAELQEDPRVADALRQRYAPDKDWTNK